MPGHSKGEPPALTPPTRRRWPAALLLTLLLLTAATLFAPGLGAMAAAGNLAQGRPASASSTEKAGLEAGKAFDGSNTTRWSSAFSDPEWLAVDLGTTYEINRVVLLWETAYGKAYALQVSTDGVA